MKKIISILLVAAMLMSVMLFAVSCDKGGAGKNETTVADGAGETEAPKSTKVEGDLKAIYESVNEKVNFSDYMDEVITKEEDSDEMIMMWYGIVDMEAADHLTDYIISMPTDYCNTYAVFVFDTEVTEEIETEVKAAVLENYTRLRASALQMYMPEEYAKMSWACENEALTWRVYDNAMALFITGDSEPTEAFDAFEAEALK
ncbi:MAG: hypothetical protein IJ499_06510 [Clostridia bacterium]|nr:hypothetical protein [Clostridia bacterium]